MQTRLPTEPGTDWLAAQSGGPVCAQVYVTTGTADHRVGGGLFGNANHLAVYAVTPVYSPKQQEVTLRAGASDQLRLWLNGKLIHEHTQSRTAQPNQDKLRVTLRPGWNVLLAKVTNFEGEHVLYLRISGD